MPTADTPMEHLHEQMELLRSHAANFDAGRVAFVKPLATTLRTLLYNEGHSRGKALLAQLGVLDTMPFLDSAGEVDPQNQFDRITIAAWQVTAMIQMTEEGPVHSGEPEGEYFAPLEVGLEGRWRGFLDWWKQEAVAIDADGVRFSRWDFVLGMVHKEGGGHVDPVMKDAYRKLTRANGLGYSYGTGTNGKIDDESLRPEGDPSVAAVRQIGWETELSIVRQFPELRLP